MVRTWNITFAHRPLHPIRIEADSAAITATYLQLKRGGKSVLIVPLANLFCAAAEDTTAPHAVAAEVATEMAHNVVDVTERIPQSQLVQDLGGWGDVGEPESGNYFQLFQGGITPEGTRDPAMLSRICEHMGAFIDAALRRGVAYPGGSNEPSMMGGIGDRDPRALRLVRPPNGGPPWTMKTFADDTVVIAGRFSLAERIPVGS